MPINPFPFIPGRPVTLAALDSRYCGPAAPPGCDLAAALAGLGIAVVAAPLCPALSPPVGAHPDMLLHPLGGGVILTAPNAPPGLREQLTAAGFTVIKGETILRADYPGDVAYNVARLGRVAFHNPKATDPVLARELRRRGISLQPVRQGYAKCATVILHATALITEDWSVRRAALAAGIDTLLISPGPVRLPGLSHGFLGGASGLIAPGVLAVTGDIESHPDYDAISAFCSKHGVRLQALRSGECIDTGSIIPLSENV